MNQFKIKKSVEENDVNIELGRWNNLTVLRQSDYGMYLDGGTLGDILMPRQYVPRGCEPGDEVEVFVYLDQEERLVATTENPLAQVGDFAYLRVAWVNQYGAFLDWGLMKDLFVPFREQKMRMVQDRSYVVHIHIDEETSRIVASAKVERYLCDDMPPYQQGDAVDVMIWQKTDLGLKAIIDNRYSGLFYDDELFREVRTGDRLTAYIKLVRPDGKIDLSLQRPGLKGVRDFADVLLERLQESGGFLPYTDKTASDELNKAFGVSKKTFKRAVGTLYKKHLIRLEENGLFMVE